MNAGRALWVRAASAVGWIARRGVGLIGVVVFVGTTTYLLLMAMPGGLGDRPRGCRLDEARCRALDDRFNVHWPVANCIRYMQPVVIDLSTCFAMPARTQLVAYLVYGYKEDGRLVPGVLLGSLGYTLRQPDRTVQDLLFVAPPGQPAWNSEFGYSLRLLVLALGFALPVALARLAEGLGPVLANWLALSGLVEIMFGFPGMGLQMAASVWQRDLMTVAGIIIVYALLAAVANVAVDLARGRLVGAARERLARTGTF